MEERLGRLLSQLSENDFMTSSTLAVQLNVSEKTVRTRIKELEFILQNHGAKIISKQRKGYILDIYDPQLFHKFLTSSQTQNQAIPINSRERVQFILNYLLWDEISIKLDDLSELLCVSKSTLAIDMKKVEEILQEYHIDILRKPYYGIKIHGSEMDIRFCIINQLAKQKNFLNLTSTEMNNQYKIANIVKNVLLENQLYISELLLQDIVTHLDVTLKRIEKNFIMPYSAATHLWVEDKMSEALQTTQIIAKQIVKEMKISIPTQEIDYIAIHLVGKRIIHSKDNQELNVVISSEVYTLVNDILDCIYTTYQIDIRDNFDLRISLGKHLVPLDIRLRYDMVLENPLLDEIKHTYSYSFAIASQAVLPITMKYHKKLNENEIGYIALILAVVLEQPTQIEKKNVLLICNEGRYMGQLLAYRYQEEFERYLNEIKICHSRELETISLKNIDYILTTIPIKSKLDIPILEVKTFLNDDEIAFLKKAFIKEKCIYLNEFFDRKLFFTNIEFQTKEEIIYYLCKKIGKHKTIPPHFYHSILQREQLATTDFGNLVALPHPNNLYTEDNFACVGILNKPVFWGIREVQIVILISISKADSSNFEKFFNKTTKFAMDNHKVNLLLENQNFDKFIELLNEG